MRFERDDAHDRYFPPLTPDGVAEDAQVQLGLADESSLVSDVTRRVSLTTTVAVLTALTLAISLMIGAVKTVAAATRHYDQMERVLVAVAHLDTTVNRLVVRVDQLESARGRP